MKTFTQKNVIGKGKENVGKYEEIRIKLKSSSMFIFPNLFLKLLILIFCKKI